MAEFCRQCAENLYPHNGGDIHKGDFVGITTIEEEAQGLYAVVLCEGCGPIQVDSEGNCITPDCLEKHGVNEISKS